MTPKDRHRQRRIVRRLKPGDTLVITVTARKHVALLLPDEADVKIKKAVDNGKQDRQ